MGARVKQFSRALAGVLLPSITEQSFEFAFSRATQLLGQAVHEPVGVSDSYALRFTHRCKQVGLWVGMSQVLGVAQRCSEPGMAMRFSIVSSLLRAWPHGCLRAVCRFLGCMRKECGLCKNNPNKKCREEDNFDECYADGQVGLGWQRAPAGEQLAAELAGDTPRFRGPRSGALHAWLAIRATFVAYVSPFVKVSLRFTVAVWG